MNSPILLLLALQFVTLGILSYRMGTVEKRLATALNLLRALQPKPEPEKPAETDAETAPPADEPADEDAEPTRVMTRKELKQFAGSATLTPTLLSEGTPKKGS